jgi:diguanylate cyclase (GGDEF)-like protein
VDATTLRVTFAAIAVVMLMLFVVAAYRPTRAPFAGWWSLALLLFMLSTLAFLANGSALQVVLNPAGNALGVAGTMTAWTAAESLRGRRPSWWLLAAGPLVALLTGALDDPAHDTWSGGAPFLALMTAGYELTAWSSWQASRHETVDGEDPAYTALTRSLAVAAGVLGLAYLARLGAYLAVGPHDPTFVRWFGTAPTTLLIIVTLVTVSFSMASLSNHQVLADLRRRASHDGLTGLLNRQAFLARATERLQALRHAELAAVTVMADLDHFKAINDGEGHATGDLVLRSFGDACRAALRQDDACGRLGGEEFAILLGDCDAEEAVAVLRRLVDDFARRRPAGLDLWPTISFGLAPALPEVTLGESIERADVALYRAKAAGRDQIVVG